MPAQVHIQGAGQVNIYAALTYGLNQRLVPSSVSFGASHNQSCHKSGGFASSISNHARCLRQIFEAQDEDEAAWEAWKA